MTAKSDKKVQDKLMKEKTLELKKTIESIKRKTYEETRRERPKSAPYLRLKNIQGTTIGKIWKKNFFKKKF